MPTLTLQRLNMDTTWHCTLGDLRVLVDPWLVGTEVDYFGWFNTQWHRTPPMPCADIPAFDTVLITQKYPDHCHPLTLETLQPTESPEVVYILESPCVSDNAFTNFTASSQLTAADPHCSECARRGFWPLPSSMR